MAYLKVIEETALWTCPKTADYKIICVAGGCPGGFYYDYKANQGGTEQTFSGQSAALFGEPTSFGDYLTASGTDSGSPDVGYTYEGMAIKSVASTATTYASVYRTGPRNGFSMHNSTYGQQMNTTIPPDIDLGSTSPSILTKVMPYINRASGYGAGGHFLAFKNGTFYINSNNSIALTGTALHLAGGNCGKLAMLITPITENTEVLCTVGRSTYEGTTAESAAAGWSNMSAYTLGNDGVIIIQEV